MPAAPPVQEVPDNEEDVTIISHTPPMEISPVTGEENAETATSPILQPVYTNNVLSPGTMLGHFLITKYIGGGGMGCVYEAEDKTLERRVAIKVLSPQRAQDRASVNRFLNEAKSAARLNHEHIAQVYFCGEDNGIPYIAFEYVQGINIRTYVGQNGVIPLPQAINFILQISSALAHAAMHGVTHRDVKPSNILITEQGHAKLIDMGLARLFKTSDSENDLTASGVTLGTFDYISPEQALDPRNADVRSDIYSLGCTFFFMLTGQPPFPEGTVLQKLLQHQGNDPPDVRELNPSIPAEVAMVIQKMMAKNPPDRFQTPKALIDVLSDIAEMIGLHPVDLDQTMWEAPATSRWNLKRHIPWITSISLLLLVVICFRYFSVRNSQIDFPVIIPTITGPPSPKSTTDISGKTPVETTEKGAGTELPASLMIRQIVVPTGSVSGISLVENGSLQETDSRGFSCSSSVMAPERLAGGAILAPLNNTSVLLKPGAGIADREGIHLQGGWFHHQLLNPSVVADVVRNTDTLSRSLVIDRIGENNDTYANIQTALNSISNSGDLSRNLQSEIKIELRFNGALEVNSLSLQNKKIRIVATEGYQPTLVFKSDESSWGGIGEQMFLLNSASLTIERVNIEFTVPSSDIMVSEWSMFEMIGDSSLKITDSVLTLFNSDTGGIAGSTAGTMVSRHSNVAFFRWNSVGKDLRENAENQPVSVPTVSLERTLVRGESTFLYTRSVYGLLDVKHCQVNTSGAFVYLMETERNEAETTTLNVQLDHLLGICRSSCFRHEANGRIDRESFISATITNSILKGGNQAFGMWITSEISDTESLVAPEWKLENSVLFNFSEFGQLRLKQGTRVQDIEFPGTVNLVQMNFSDDVSNRLDSIFPHAFTLENFQSLFLKPMELMTRDTQGQQLIQEFRSTLPRFSE